MSEVKYKYYLLKKCWLARLEKDRYGLEDKEFFKDGVWQYDDELNLELNDCMMDRGDSSVFDFDEIPEEEALEQIKLSNIILSEQQISNAKECYLFGDKILYIVVDKDSDVVVFNLESKHWSKRKADSLWDSLNFDPTVFIPISTDETIRMIYSADESEERVSKKKAVELFDKGILDSLEPGKFESLKVIHKHLFVEI